MFALLFYLTAAVAVISTLLMITRPNAVHSLLYLILSSLSMAIVFYLLGAPFAAVLEVIIYAGAIMILFVFVVMMLNLGQRAVANEKQWLPPKGWIIPGLLGLILFAVVASIMIESQQPAEIHEVSAQRVGVALYGPYLLVVELASFLLLAGLIGAYHIARSPAARAGGTARPDETQEQQPSMNPSTSQTVDEANKVEEVV